MENHRITERPPIFVIGVMRSGTTLLRLTLDAHPDIAIGPESFFARGAAAAFCPPDWSQGEEWFKRFDEDSERFLLRLRQMYGGFFSDYARRRGKTRWGEKTPGHHHHLELLGRIFPDAQFVAIFRHPGAVIDSLSKWSHTTDDAMKIWLAGLQDVEAAILRTPHRWHVLRYEDLVTQPEPALRDILAFLDEPWSDRVLNHERAPERRTQPEVTDGGTNTRDAIDPTRLGRWRDHATAEVLSTLQTHASALARLGYEPRETSPAGPLTGAFASSALPTPPVAACSDARWRDLAPPLTDDWRPRAQVQVVIGHQGSLSCLELTLAALAQQTYDPKLMGIIIAPVRGAELAGLPALLSMSPLSCLYDGSTAHVELSRAQHHGVMKATADIMVFISSGAGPGASWLREHAYWHHQVADAATVGALGDAVSPKNSAEFFRAAKLELGLRRETCLQLMGLPGASPDADLSLRAWHQGLVIVPMGPGVALVDAPSKRSTQPRVQASAPWVIRIIGAQLPAERLAPVVWAASHSRKRPPVVVVESFDAGVRRRLKQTFGRQSSVHIVAHAEDMTTHPLAPLRVVQSGRVLLKPEQLSGLLNEMGGVGIVRSEVQTGDGTEFIYLAQTRALARARRVCATARDDSTIESTAARLFGATSLPPETIGLNLYTPRKYNAALAALAPLAADLKRRVGKQLVRSLPPKRAQQIRASYHKLARLARRRS